MENIEKIVELEFDSRISTKDFLYDVERDIVKNMEYIIRALNEEAAREKYMPENYQQTINEYKNTIKEINNDKAIREKEYKNFIYRKKFTEETCEKCNTKGFFKHIGITVDKWGIMHYGVECSKCKEHFICFFPAERKKIIPFINGFIEVKKKHNDDASSIEYFEKMRDGLTEKLLDESKSIISIKDKTDDYLQTAEELLNQTILFKLAIKQGGKPFGGA